VFTLTLLATLGKSSEVIDATTVGPQRVQAHYGMVEWYGMSVSGRIRTEVLAADNLLDSGGFCYISADGGRQPNRCYWTVLH
jgi:hypothetical protein